MTMASSNAAARPGRPPVPTCRAAGRFTFAATTFAPVVRLATDAGYGLRSIITRPARRLSSTGTASSVAVVAIAIATVTVTVTVAATAYRPEAIPRPAATFRFRVIASTPPARIGRATGDRPTSTTSGAASKALSTLTG